MCLIVGVKEGWEKVVINADLNGDNGVICIYMYVYGQRTFGGPLIIK